MLSKFFVGSKGWLADLEETLVREILGAPVGASPQTFDDQYISTGGQFHQLFTGRDRFNADLRPLAHRKLGQSSPLLCASLRLLHRFNCHRSGRDFDRRAGRNSARAARCRDAGRVDRLRQRRDSGAGRAGFAAAFGELREQGARNKVGECGSP